MQNVNLCCELQLGLLNELKDKPQNCTANGSLQDGKPNYLEQLLHLQLLLQTSAASVRLAAELWTFLFCSTADVCPWILRNTFVCVVLKSKCQTNIQGQNITSLLEVKKAHIVFRNHTGVGTHSQILNAILKE